VEPLAADRAGITISVDFEGQGGGKLLVPLLVRRQARGEMPQNLARLKQRVQGSLGTDRPTALPGRRPVS
jgi:hypothetical protein